MKKKEHAIGRFRPPDREQLLAYLWSFCWLSLLFLAVYPTTNWLSAQRADVHGWYWDWELQIPMLPGMIYLYASIYGLMVLPLFCLNTLAIRRLAQTFAGVTLIAGVLFLLLPGRLGFLRPLPVQGYEAVFHWLYTLDLTHNLVPSLHIVYSTLLVGVIIQHIRQPIVTFALFIWLLGISLSVLLVHQHHVVDVLTGWLLGGAAVWYNNGRVDYWKDSTNFSDPDGGGNGN